MTISREILLRMRNVSNKSCTENQNTNCMIHNIFHKNRAVCEIMMKNVVPPDAADDNMGARCTLDY